MSDTIPGHRFLKLRLGFRFGLSLIKQDTRNLWHAGTVQLTKLSAVIGHNEMLVEARTWKSQCRWAWQFWTTALTATSIFDVGLLHQNRLYHLQKDNDSLCYFTQFVAVLDELWFSCSTGTDIFKSKIQKLVSRGWIVSIEFNLVGLCPF